MVGELWDVHKLGLAQVARVLLHLLFRWFWGGCCAYCLLRGVWGLFVACVVRHKCLDQIFTAYIAAYYLRQGLICHEIGCRAYELSLLLSLIASSSSVFIEDIVADSLLKVENIGPFLLRWLLEGRRRVSRVARSLMIGCCSAHYFVHF